MANIFQTMEKAMGMSDAIWLRHANPWSVYTRMAILPLICLAIWARVWLGWWCLIPLVLLVLFVWINTRLFPVPANFNAWASHGVFGERVFLNHRDQVAPHHLRALTILASLSGVGIIPMVWGLWSLESWAVIAGVALVVLPKIWFVDRAAWVWQDWLATGRTHTDL